jgi:hypothetical protein
MSPPRHNEMLECTHGEIHPVPLPLLDDLAQLRIGKLHRKRHRHRSHGKKGGGAEKKLLHILSSLWSGVAAPQVLDPPDPRPPTFSKPYLKPRKLG